MGDMGDTFRAMREHSKERRNKAFEDNMKKIQVSGVPYLQKNHGYHVIIGEFDFWPSSGRWKNRITRKYGRGTEKMIKQVLRMVK